MFAFYDSNFDGVLSSEEVRSLIAMMGKRLTDAELDEALRDLPAPECARRGVSVLGLKISESDAAGPGGRTRLRLEARSGRLAAHRLGVRAEVTLRGKGSGEVRAVVSRATPDALERERGFGRSFLMCDAPRVCDGLRAGLTMPGL